ncbi:ribosomal protein S18-alanine N-acetyltransferase [Luteimonas sp. M1R5S18]|jgi:ribosomal-protein-alanine N-acetyltransferase|uniref:[Ribosomal protein bS18]-alanine N-acetyltransferase n=1 Tax=Luteimonas rhizosphaericola TaxID=3042024 RepID=A0ABT6JI00_9GAMM|nr:ribosomal protein S18-alanine N-acetyltransferase [Luteimonas rhizosphaericola]MDH5830305.1 ribosomal protein S18-alanine N-acetyltransferase [Luteimonas rhizosphaericola]
MSAAGAVAAGVPQAALRPMREDDLDAVMAIEVRAYPFPWTVGIFRDCLRAGYPSWVLQSEARIIGYGVLSVAVGEAHLLNVCIEPAEQGRGHGRRLLRGLERAARGQGAQRVFLEVRPSNPAAIALYHDEGFNEIGRRPRYYPAHQGREDAIVMAKELMVDGWA